VGMLGGRNDDQRRGGRRPRWLLLGLGIGALVQYLRDPQQGRTRRARLKDQAAARARRPVREAGDLVRKKSKVARDRVTGIAHEATTRDAHRVPDDDIALVNKVRSEALGGEDWRPYTINVDAVEGVVTLRGVLDRQDQIEAAEHAVRGVPGVVRVESYLHLPGEQPRNVQAARHAGR
jgi:osmotically-inducible protein OsmY